MARFNAIFKLLVIFVSYSSFVDGEETTLEERRVAWSTLFRSLDNFVADKYKSGEKFDKCCNDDMEKQNFGKFELFGCLDLYFSNYQRGLAEKEQDFKGKEKETRRNELKDVLTAHQNAMNSGTKTTHPVNNFRSDVIAGWIKTLNEGNPILNANAETSRMAFR